MDKILYISLEKLKKPRLGYTAKILDSVEWEILQFA